MLIALAVLGALGWAARHSSGACACGAPISFGRTQPGFHRLNGPVADAVARLPVRIRLARAVGAPVGVYSSGRRALVLYGRGSLAGVFRFTAQPRPPGFGPHALRDLARECDVCTDNRLILLAPGVRGAVMVGGNGANSITWLEHGLDMEVTGPAATFSNDHAVAAARALARANRG